MLSATKRKRDFDSPSRARWNEPDWRHLRKLKHLPEDIVPLNGSVNLTLLVGGFVVTTSATKSSPQTCTVTVHSNIINDNTFTKSSDTTVAVFDMIHGKSQHAQSAPSFTFVNHDECDLDNFFIEVRQDSKSNVMVIVASENGTTFFARIVFKSNNSFEVDLVENKIPFLGSNELVTSISVASKLLFMALHDHFSFQF